MKQKNKISSQLIKSKIKIIREEKVILDYDLIKILGCTKTYFNKITLGFSKVFREKSRFRLTKIECEDLKIENLKGKLPLAYNMDGIEILSRIVDNNVYSEICMVIIYELNNYEIRDYKIDNVESPIKTQTHINYSKGKLIFKSKNKDKIWVTQKDLADLFNVSINTINQNIRDISDKELNSLTMKKSINKCIDNIKYKDTYYNIDMILSLGLKIEGTRGIEYRRWVISILKEYLFSKRK